jgi:chaperonin cofactor prefoldin
MMVKLYELTNSMLGLRALDDDQAVIDTIEGLEMQFNDKAANVIMYERDIKTDMEAIDSEITRLKARRDSMKRRLDSMRNYLRENMERAGIKRIDCPLFTITCAEGRPIAEIESIDELPDDCVRIETKIVPDKTRILQKLKDNEDVPGAKLSKSLSSIRVK